MDGKFWMYIVFLVISLLYQVWKKQNKNKEELPPSVNNPSKPEKGLEDLIAEFNKAYGVETVEEEVMVQPDPEPVMETPKPEENRYHKPDISDYIVKEKSEPQTLHERVVQNEKEKEKLKQEKVEEENISLDLETLILSDVILNRPKY